MCELEDHIVLISSHPIISMNPSISKLPFKLFFATRRVGVHQDMASDDAGRRLGVKGLDNVFQSKFP